MMEDRKLYVDVTYDDTSMDVTLVYFREPTLAPVQMQGKRLAADLDGLDLDDWGSVKDVLIAIIEQL